MVTQNWPDNFQGPQQNAAVEGAVGPELLATQTLLLEEGIKLACEMQVYVGPDLGISWVLGFH